MIYLISPYTHSDPAVQYHRYRQACRATAKLMAAGIPVFSPLCNSVPAVELGGLEMDHDGFMEIDLPLLHRCDEVLVIGLDGWAESKGVRREMFEALALRKPVVQIEEADIERLPAIPKTARTFLKSNIFTEVYDDAD